MTRCPVMPSAGRLTRPPGTPTTTTAMTHEAAHPSHPPAIVPGEADAAEVTDAGRPRTAAGGVQTSFRLRPAVKRAVAATQAYLNGIREPGARPWTRTEVIAAALIEYDRVRAVNRKFLGLG